MSQDSKPNVFASALRVIRDFLFARPSPAPRFAHPWSAYKPETYLAGAAPQGIIIATRAHSLLARQPSNTHLRLVSVAEDNNAASLGPLRTEQTPTGIAAHTGQSFQLSARLQGVAKLNRKSISHVQRRPRSFAATNRPVPVETKPLRLANIAPPAVQRPKQRRSAEVIHLNLILARSVHKAKAYKAA